MASENQEQSVKLLKTLPLRNVVIYPNAVIPLKVGRTKSIETINRLEKQTDNGGKRYVFLITQKELDNNNPQLDDLYHIGTIAELIEINRQPEGSVEVQVRGEKRAKLLEWYDVDGFFQSKIEIIQEAKIDPAEEKALHRIVLEQFKEYVKKSKKIASQTVNNIIKINDLNLLIDSITIQLELSVKDGQQILETLDINKRADLLLNFLNIEADIKEVEERINKRVKSQLEKNQHEYVLNEKIKAIQKELGEEDDRAELAKLEDKIKSTGMSQEAEEKALAEWKKLKSMSLMSPEATVIRNYIDVLINLPWGKKSSINQDIAHAKEILDADHFGLEKVKERILEYLAVQKRVDKIKGPILCLVGPPGVGKTSLGQSIAKATGRKYVRMALGGVHDESEIRGHRRTYVASMPGKILQNITKVGVNNPLFLLDEVDKLGQDFHGDPASALLEVLDPEQNHTFSDNFAEVDYDLSDVMFIATSNTLQIPPALLDRMEIIRLSGYTEEEKVNIAMQYLVPKQIKVNGLKKTEITIEESAIQDIIRYYTREAGVRSLDREIAKICRKVVMQNALLEDNPQEANAPKKRKRKIKVSSKNLHDFLGVQRFDFGKAETENRIGQVTGLAWTEVGGELLSIETTALKGKGNIIRTGQLGDVMQESIVAALSVVRSRAGSLGIAPDFYEKHDLHVHVPEGATPKDGPSAGIAITLAIVSSLTNIPVRSDIAMTGEITLRGEVLPIGGLKEKLLAALRGGIKHVLIPKNNIKDLEEIPNIVTENIEIHPVQWIDEVLEFGLESQPKPWQKPKENTQATTDKKTIQ